MIDASVATVYALWTSFEELPRMVPSVRRVKQIGSKRVLWDLEIAGRQIVWEARIIDRLPERLVRWYSSAGRPNRGEVRFEAVGAAQGPRTRMTVEIEFAPDGLLERLAAKLGLIGRRVARDLSCFAMHAEKVAEETLAATPPGRTVAAGGQRAGWSSAAAYDDGRR